MVLGDFNMPLLDLDFEVVEEFRVIVAIIDLSQITEGQDSTHILDRF